MSDVTAATAPTPERLIRLPEVRRLTGLGKTQIYERMRHGTFPRATKIGVSTLWVESEVQAWIHARIAERDAA